MVAWNQKTHATYGHGDEPFPFTVSWRFEQYNSKYGYVHQTKTWIYGKWDRASLTQHGESIVLHLSAEACSVHFIEPSIYFFVGFFHIASASGEKWKAMALSSKEISVP